MVKRVKLVIGQLSQGGQHSQGGQRGQGDEGGVKIQKSSNFG